MKGNLLRLAPVLRALWKSSRAVRYLSRDNNGSKSIFARRGFFFRVSIFPTFPFDFFFSSRVCRTGKGGCGEGSKRAGNRCARAMIYRYNVIADTEGGRSRGWRKRDGSGVLTPPSLPLPRYIDLFSSFAYELFRFGSPGVYSRMKICSAAKYFSVVARLSVRAACFRPPLPFEQTNPPPLPIVQRARVNFIRCTYLYTAAPRYLARTCACVRDGERAELLSISRGIWGTRNRKRKINNRRKEFLVVPPPPPL